MSEDGGFGDFGNNSREADAYAAGEIPDLSEEARQPIWFTLYFFFIWSLFFMGALVAGSISGQFLNRQIGIWLAIGLFFVLLGYSQYTYWLIKSACSEGSQAAYVLLSFASMVGTGIFATIFGQEHTAGLVCYVWGLTGPVINFAVFVQLALSDYSASSTEAGDE